MTTLPMLGECVCTQTLMLGELLEQYFAEKKINSRADANNIKKAFTLLFEFCPAADTNNFTARALRIYQRHLAALGYERTYLNKLINFVKAVFQWGNEHDLVSDERNFNIGKVSALKCGEAKEKEPRTDVPVEYVEQVLPHVPPVVADILRLQMLTGMRPSEVCRMTAADIDTKLYADFWVYAPEQHKTKRKGKRRCVLLDADCQAILMRYKLSTATDANTPLFLNAKGHQAKTMWVDHVVSKAIEEHQLPKFTPYQIRHRVGTDISRDYGRDAARAFLGHSHVNTTRIYDHSDLDKVIGILRRKSTVSNPMPDEVVSIRLWKGGAE